MSAIVVERYRPEEPVFFPTSVRLCSDVDIGMRLAEDAFRWRSLLLPLLLLLLLVLPNRSAIVSMVVALRTTLL